MPRPVRLVVPRVPHVIVHSLAQAEAALRAASDLAIPIVLESPRDAARAWGAPYFLAMIAAARAAVPDAQAEAILDCGAAPGLALEALRCGVKTVRLRDAEDVVARVADIAAQVGARLEPGPYPVAMLDLDGARDAYEAARRYIGEREA